MNKIQILLKLQNQ